jgi:transcriptional regulator with XRE-family HTH domain
MTDGTVVSDDRKPRLAKQLRRLIEYLGLSDSEFAAALNVAPSTVSRALSGDRGGRAIPDAAWRELHVLPGYWLDEQASVDVFINDPSRWRSVLGPKAEAILRRVPHAAKESPERDWHPIGYRDPLRNADAALLANSVQDDVRIILARISADRDDAPSVVKGIMRAGPPPGVVATLEWWLRHYLYLLDAEATRKRKAEVERVIALLRRERFPERSPDETRDQILVLEDEIAEAERDFTARQEEYRAWESAQIKAAGRPPKNAG